MGPRRGPRRPVRPLDMGLDQLHHFGLVTVPEHFQEPLMVDYPLPDVVTKRSSVYKIDVNL